MGGWTCDQRVRPNGIIETLKGHFSSRPKLQESIAYSDDDDIWFHVLQKKSTGLLHLEFQVDSICNDMTGLLRCPININRIVNAHSDGGFYE
jgi:hypothetical protein